jgi:hypothetical protein
MVTRLSQYLSPLSEPPPYRAADVEEIKRAAPELTHVSLLLVERMWADWSSSTTDSPWYPVSDWAVTVFRQWLATAP